MTEVAGPFPRDLAARYERLRAVVLLRGSPDSHEAALIVHRGIPGWVDCARRFGEGRSPLDPPRTDAATPSQGAPAGLLPCRQELVTVLASVVLHCLETTP
jgi:hypothetical protein